MWILAYVAGTASISALVMWLTLEPWTGAERVGLQRQASRNQR
jgi:hypothetical protein